MPIRPALTDYQKRTAIQLRSKSMAYVKIAHQIEVNEKAVTKFLKSIPDLPKSVMPLTKAPPPKPVPTKPKVRLLPVHQFHGSCPTHRRAVNLDSPQLTHKQLQLEYEQAVRNTVLLVSSNR
jgi:hypothetical protein